MTFKRTKSSLYSLHKFFGVDIVVFCEGGPSMTAADAMLPATSLRNLDTIYWSTVVDHLKFRKRFHFKSGGNKETLVKIAEDASLLKAENITICMDADYDFHISRAHPYNRIAYTFGYSWESDVLHPPVLYNILTHVTGPVTEDTRRDFFKTISNLNRDLRKWCEIDISLRSKSLPCVLDREKPMSVVKFDQSPPWICTQTLTKNLNALGYTRGPKRICRVTVDNVLRVCFGKLTSKLLYHIVKFYAGKLTKFRLDYEAFMRIAIRESFTLMKQNELPEFASHLAAQRAAFR